MRVLVTGASGFIGGAFLRRFASLRDVTLYGVGRKPAVNFPASVGYSVLPLARLDELDFTPDVVIHAAGKASPWGTPEEYQRDNVVATQQVIDFCHRNGLPRLIFISSAAVYYRFAHQYALKESASPGPAFTSEYGRSKYAAEQRIAAYQGEKTVLRPCAVFGDGDRLLLPPLMAAAQKGKLMKLRSPDQKAQSELMHVDVLCDYLMQSATYPSLRPVYNISANRPVETEDFLCQVLKGLHLPAPHKTVSLPTALRFAQLTEWLWRYLPLKGAPPVTRFGIAVFGYSNTLDVTAMLADFGPPAVDFDTQLCRFLSDYRRHLA